jgi:hypothetical protein
VSSPQPRPGTQPPVFQFDADGFSGRGLHERMRRAHEMAELIDNQALPLAQLPTVRAWLAGISAALRAVSKP